jgi:hypothetical protein
MHDDCAINSLHPGFPKVVLKHVEAQQAGIAGAP